MHACNSEGTTYQIVRWTDQVVIILLWPANASYLAIFPRLMVGYHNNKLLLLCDQLVTDLMLVTLYMVM